MFERFLNLTRFPGQKRELCSANDRARGPQGSACSLTNHKYANISTRTAFGRMESYGLPGGYGMASLNEVCGIIDAGTPRHPPACGAAGLLVRNFSVVW